MIEAANNSHTLEMYKVTGYTAATMHKEAIR